MVDINILPLRNVLFQGIEFTGDMCFSGKHGQEVFDKPLEEGGKPISGLLYENHKNGFSDGYYVNYYENGKVANFQRMSNGVVSGKSISWFENGNIKLIAEYKSGFNVTCKEWDIEGKLLTEKTEPSEFEKKMIDKYDKRAE